MNKSNIITLVISSIVLVFVFCIALMVGSYNISVVGFFKAIFTTDEAYSIQRSVIVNLRLPRTLIALFTGAALSLSGILYQELFQNKLVSPDLLGVSSGSGVGAALALMLGLGSGFVMMFSFIFGVATVLLTIILGRCFKDKSSIMLLLSGIIVGGLMSSILSFIKYLADAETTLAAITYWLMGSFENSTMPKVYILGSIVIVCSVILVILARKINLVGLGKEEATSKGLNYTLYRYIIIIIATLLTASSVAVAGTISWVGLAIPHIVRLACGRETYKTIPITIPVGGIFMIVTDILSRSFSKAEIPISAVTGLFGTIIIIGVVLWNRRNVHEYH
ncbi:MAG: iron ABC transporter permease [Bacilli bacterium]|nr:iron ABC transporter permease [Bacilli bacterium]